MRRQLGLGPFLAAATVMLAAVPTAAAAVVEVDTVQELADACWTLASGDEIVVAAGTYDLSDHVFPNGEDGRLTVGRFGAPPIDDVTIRGATGRPEDVVITGAGMGDPIVPFGFQIFTATDVVIEDLSVGEVYFHAVAIQNDQGATRVTLRNLRLFNAGQQIVKASAGDNPGAADVVIEGCELFYTAGVPAHPDVGSCYTNAVDALPGHGWVIRDNWIHDITCQDGSLAGPAILMWGGSSDTVVERNRIVDCSRGVALGLVSAADHSGGIVRNNTIRWDPDASYVVDVPIYTTSAEARIFHNTALVQGRYANAVEVRFAGATGVEVRGNLLDAAITARDGADLVAGDNLLTADPSWFADEAAGDLHLAWEVPAVVDQADPVAGCEDDLDGAPRPTTAGLVDLGADEWGLFVDGFEDGTTAAWSATLG